MAKNVIEARQVVKDFGEVRAAQLDQLDKRAHRGEAQDRDQAQAKAGQDAVGGHCLGLGTLVQLC